VTPGAARALVWVAAPLGCLATTLPHALDDRWVRTDFLTFYLAFAVARRGGNPYDLEALRHSAGNPAIEEYVFPYLYPPLLAQLGAPLAALPIFEAQTLWLLASVAVFAVTATATILWVGRGTALLPSLVFGLLLFWILPFPQNLAAGQSRFLVFGLVALALWAAMARRADFASGLALALAGLIKVTPLLLVAPFAVRRRPRVLLGAAVGTLLFAGLAAAVGGVGPWIEFARYLPETSYGREIPGLYPPAEYPNFSPAGLLSRLLPGRVAAVGALSLLAVGALAALLLYRIARARSDVEHETLLLPLLALCVIAAPYVYLHHVVLILPGALFAICHAWCDRGLARRGGWIGLLLALTLVASVDFPARYAEMDLSEPGRRALTSLNLYALLGLYAAGLLLAGRVSSRPPQEPAKSTQMGDDHARGS
jgi:hypothetical protein